MSYDSPASLGIGSGGFPYALSAGHGFHQGAPPTADFGPIFPGSPAGWISNWYNALTVSGSGMEGMGASDVRAAAGAIAAFMAAQDVYKASPSAARDVAAVLTQSWLMHQFSGNSVSVTLNGGTRQFVRLADGSWTQPGASFATLTETGTRSPFTYICPAWDIDRGADYALNRGWDNSGLGFTVTNAAGDQQHFVYWLQHYQTADLGVGSECGRASGFRFDHWSFPQGMTVTAGYSADTSTSDGTNHSSSPNAGTSYPSSTTLATVDNGIGRTLTFTAGNVSDGTRTLEGPQLFGDGTFGVVDPAGAITDFTFGPVMATSATQRPVPYQPLTQVATPFYAGSNPHTLDLQYDYDALGQVAAVHDAVNLQRPGARDPYGFRIADGTRGERDDPLGNPYTVVYDTYRHPSQYIDELGRITTALFDSRSRVSRYTYPEADSEFFAYDDQDNTTGYTRTAKPGSSLANLNVSAVYDPTWNKPTSITNARGVTTTFTYYASGTGASLMATAVRPADGYGNGPATYSFSYTSIGKPLTAVDPDSVTTTNGYDSAGNLTSTALDPAHLDIVTQFGYDATGNVTSTTDPRDNVTTSSYDADRRKLEDDHHNGSSSAALLAASQTVYDAHGWVTDTNALKTISPAAWITTAHNTYTPIGKVAMVTDADNRTVVTAYDALDRVATVTDPVGKAMHNTYDAAGQLLIEYRGWLTPLQQAYATHTWTPNGKEASVYDALGGSHLTQYIYDGFDRLNSTIYADASHEDLTYDADANVLTRVNRAGATLSYVYDNLDRLHSKAIPSSAANAAHSITSVYSLAGRPTSLTDSAGPVVATAYDTAGRATSETQTILGTARTVASQLDPSGNRTRLTWPDGYAVDYEFDALNRMSTATVHGGSLLATYTYDPLSRRTALSYNSGTSSMSYSYSDAGDLLTLTNDLAGTANDVTYTNTYTPAHQLQSETTSNTAYIWAPPSASSSYAAVNALNQYPSVDGGSLTWDGNGNLATISGATYTHDPENRMVSATPSGAPAATYTYDPVGRRIAKSFAAVGTGGANWGAANWGSFNWTSAASATSFLHDGDSEIAEYDTSGTLVRRFVPGVAVDDYVAMVTTGGATTFFHTDRHGSIIAMADTTGASVEGPYTYDVYGNCFVGSTSCTTLATTTEPFRYTGQRYDAETGLYYYRARMYCVSIGRFCETDPAGYGPDVNWYTYVHNDPTDGTDPSGNAFVGWTAGVAAEDGSSGPCENSGNCSGYGESFQRSFYSAWFWGGGHVLPGNGYTKGNFVGHTTGRNFVRGGYIGGGVGITFGNATDGRQLRGKAETTTWNFFFLSISKSVSGKIWQESITYGPGLVGSQSRYQTDTQTGGDSGSQPTPDDLSMRGGLNLFYMTKAPPPKPKQDQGIEQINGTISGQACTGRLGKTSCNG
jgi:RHS repeat-associated protein